VVDDEKPWQRRLILKLNHEGFDAKAALMGRKRLRYLKRNLSI